MEKRIEELEKRISTLEGALKEQYDINENCIKLLAQYREELNLLTKGLALVNSIFEKFTDD